MQKIEQALTIKERIAVREAQRPQEFKGYITGLMELWLKVLGGPRNIVELGTYTGNSTFAWLSCPNTFVTTIDNGPVENARPLREDVERYDWTGRVYIVHADSIEYASQYTGLADMVYIDTSHEYLQTRREIEEWLPHVRPQGWIVMDDIASRDYPDVLRAFEHCLQVSCRDRFGWFQGWTVPPYTPSSHGLLAAKLK